MTDTKYIFITGGASGIGREVAKYFAQRGWFVGLADVNMKELLIMPNFTRLTYMVKQAERGEYLIMRNAIYENTPISKSVVEALLKQAIAIRQSIESSATVLKNQVA